MAWRRDVCWRSLVQTLFMKIVAKNYCCVMADLLPRVDKICSALVLPDMINSHKSISHNWEFNRGYWEQRGVLFLKANCSWKVRSLWQECVGTLALAEVFCLVVRKTVT